MLSVLCCAFLPYAVVGSYVPYGVLLHFLVLSCVVLCGEAVCCLLYVVLCCAVLLGADVSSAAPLGVVSCCGLLFCLDFR